MQRIVKFISNYKGITKMAEQTEVIIRANSTIKLKTPSGMTCNWTYVKGTTAKAVLDDIARSLGYKVVPKQKDLLLTTE